MKRKPNEPSGRPRRARQPARSEQHVSANAFVPVTRAAWYLLQFVEFPSAERSCYYRLVGSFPRLRAHAGDSTPDFFPAFRVFSRVDGVDSCTAFLGRSPDTATPEDLRRFQLHQTQAGVRAPTINGSVAALHFFFTVTLDRPEMARHLTFVREPRKMPAVLSPDEVALNAPTRPSGGPQEAAKQRAPQWIAHGLGESRPELANPASNCSQRSPRPSVSTHECRLEACR